MAKVLLVMDDYSEITSTTALLKKVGLQAFGISNENKLKEELLGFNPDLVIASGKSNRVSGIQVLIKIREGSSFKGKCLLILQKGQRPTPDQMLKMKVDGAMEAPIDPEKLLGVVSKLLALNLQVLLDKFHRNRASEPDLHKGPPVESSTFPLPSEADDRKRADRYKSLLKNLPPVSTGSLLTKDNVKKQWKEVQKDWDASALEDLDELRKEFVDALFKKNKGSD